HTWVQGQVDSGWMSEQEAEVSVYKSLLTRALGVAEQASADISEFEVLPGDSYLLCSDGMTDGVPAEHIGNVLRQADRPAEEIVRSLLKQALEAGGQDNVSVIVARSIST